jgi:hypothetical protein
MAWIDEITEIVSRYAGVGGGSAPAPADPHQDYVNVAKSAPPQVMADGLSQAFRSDQTPSFPEMVSSLFRQSNPDQQAGLLNRLIGTLGPAALASFPALRPLVGSAGGGQGVTPETASQISAEQVQQIANQAHRDNPSIVDQVSGFYAQHPNVVKALGGAAITIALRHIARRG